MWIYTNFGHYSICERDGKICIRARVRDDLENLFTGCYLERRNHPPLQSILEEGSDYKYRVYLDKSEFKQLMLRIASSVDYPNFKSEVLHKQGYEREHIYSQVWFAATQLEELEEPPVPLEARSHNPSTDAASPRSGQTD